MDFPIVTIVFLINFRGSGGMLGEVTMVQLYKVALTAGKAHKNHKHHHVHEFLHEGVPTPPEPSTPLPPPPTTTPSPHPFIINGQLNPALRALQRVPQLVPGAQSSTGGPPPANNFGFVQNQNEGEPIGFPVGQADLDNYDGLSQDQNVLGSQQGVPSFNGNLLNPANVKIIDCTKQDCSVNHSLFKRNNKRRTVSKRSTVSKPSTESKTSTISKRSIIPDQMMESTNKNNVKSKRGLVLANDGQIYDDGLLTSRGITSDIEMAAFLNGLAGIGDNQPVQQEQKESEQREPAEAEVRAVMNLCSGCDEEPFEKALVFDWRGVPKKLFSGAYYLPSVPKCKAF